MMGIPHWWSAAPRTAMRVMCCCCGRRLRGRRPCSRGMPSVARRRGWCVPAGRLTWWRRGRWCVSFRRGCIQRGMSTSWRVTRWRRWRVFRSWRLLRLVRRCSVARCWCRLHAPGMCRRFRANGAVCLPGARCAVARWRYRMVRRCRGAPGAGTWRSSGGARSAVVNGGVLVLWVRCAQRRSWGGRSRTFRWFLRRGIMCVPLWGLSLR